MEGVVTLPQQGKAFALEDFELEADDLRVVLASNRITSNKFISSESTPSNVTFSLHDVRITSTGTREHGHVGIHPGAYREASIVPDRAARVAAQDWTYLHPTYDQSILSTTGPARPALTGWWTKVTPRSNDGYRDYAHSVDHPNLVVESPGTFRYSGAGEVHVFGVSLVVSARENTTLLETGSFRKQEGAMDDGVQRWVILRSDNFTLKASSRDAWRIAFSELRVEDSIVTPAGVRRPFGSSPADDDALPHVASRIAPSLLVFASAAVVGVGIVVLPRLKRDPLPSHPTPLDPTESWEPEDCIARAAVHVEAGRFDRALEWLAQARRLVPTSARVRGMEAFVLGQLGKPEEALAAYAEASRLVPAEGEHDFLAARLVLRASRPVEEAEAFLIRALERSPDLAPEFDEDEILRALAERPRLAEALDRAWAEYARTLGGRDGDPQ